VLAVNDVLRCAGPGCSRPLVRLGTGRPPRYCGPNCRKAAQRARDRAADNDRQRAEQLAGAQETAARTWRPLEEASRDTEELAAAVLSYAAGADRRDVAAKLAELHQAVRQLEHLAMTYVDATELARRLKEPRETPPATAT
jgi:uncharacterized Zn finger protein (UPF0148 family)